MKNALRILMLGFLLTALIQCGGGSSETPSDNGDPSEGTETENTNSGSDSNSGSSGSSSSGGSSSSNDNATIAGTVLFKDWPVAKVTVTLEDEDGNQSTTRTAEADGSFDFDDLDAGTYTVTASLDLYQFEPSEYVINVSADSTETVEFEITSPSFPTASDIYESDNDFTSATPFTVGQAFQPHTIYSDFDEDWVAVQLTENVEYEFLTTNLCYDCDSEIFLYDTDGVTELDSNDDYIVVDSRLTYTPTVSGTYYLRIDYYSEDDPGILNYFLGIFENTDSDGDGYGSFHDCDDTDSNIHPRVSQESPGSSVDQNCDGFLVPSTDTNDVDEDTNNNLLSSITLSATVSNPTYSSFGFYRESFSRTIHNTTDTDWFQISVPAYTWYRIETNDAPQAAHYELFDTDTTTTLDSGSALSTNLVNTTDTEQTYYIEVSYLTAKTWYEIQVFDFGADSDGDGYYTFDTTNRDCDDNDASVTDECYNLP